jgi:NAD(P) transhydrogenase subunit alpha
MPHLAHLGSCQRSIRLLCVLCTLLCLAMVNATTAIAQVTPADKSAKSPPAVAATDGTSTASDAQGDSEAPIVPEPKPAASSNRLAALIGSLTIFVLAIFVGFEVINKVPPTLHTPLMSGSNAISGITVVGALLATGFGKLGFGSFLGTAAIVLAMINVAGGFWVTHRMLAMFKKKK